MTDVTVSNLSAMQASQTLSQTLWLDLLFHIYSDNIKSVEFDCTKREVKSVIDQSKSCGDVNLK